MRIPASLARPGILGAVALGVLGFGWILSPHELGGRLQRARNARAGVPVALTPYVRGLGYAGILRQVDAVTDPLEVLTLRARVALPAGRGVQRLMERRLPPYLYAPRAFTRPLGRQDVRALAAMAPVRYPPAAAGVSITAAQAQAAEAAG